LELIKRCDYSKNGQIEPWEMRDWKRKDPDSFLLMGDLLDYSSNYFS